MGIRQGVRRQVIALRVRWHQEGDLADRQLLDEMSELLRTVIALDADHAFGLTAQSLTEARNHVNQKFVNLSVPPQPKNLLPREQSTVGQSTASGSYKSPTTLRGGSKSA